MIRYLDQKRKTQGDSYLKIGFLFFCLVFANFSVYAQSTVKGQITDAKTGEPLPGVSIQVEGTTTGTVSDVDGKYFITVPSNATTLVFSYVSYVSTKMPVEGKQEINVSLVPNIQSLDQVVVIGYGTMKRSDLTGAVSSVSGKDLNNTPVTSTAEAITGRMAGVQVTTTDGSPDADVLIRVRGGGSVTQDNSPLYIVDGFPVDKISDIAPTDIASIDILKDASSTAIYGARGANGVVIITTKSPQGGKTTVSYNGWVQVKTLPKELSVLSPYEFALLQYELASLRGSTALSSYNNYFGVWGDIDIYKNLQGTDWQKQMFGQNTFSQSHNISVMGGTQTTKYNVSVTRTDDPGLMVGTGYKRTNLNFRLSHDLSKPLTVELGARLSDTEVDGAGTANSNSSTKVRSAVTYRPVNGLADFIPVDVEDLSNQLDLTSGLADPVTLANQSYEKQPRFSLNLNSAVSWRITPNLTFRSDFGVDYNYNKDNRFYGPLTTTAKNNGNLPLAQIISTTNPGYRWANTFTYNVTGLGEKHDLNMLLGQEMLSEYTSTITSTSRMFPADIAPEKALALMTLGSQEYTGTTTTPNERLASYFGRANYTFMKRYLITFTLRADGSSKFAPGKQWGYFPAAAIAWRLSDESFMKSYDFISALKVRASLGEAGNNRIPDDSYRQTYKLDSSKPIEFNEVQQPYYDPASTILYNPDLKWETTITRNVGLDFGLFKNRVNGTMDLYWNTTKDLIVQSTVPSYLGYSTQFRNIGQTSNRGIEITVNGVAVNTKDFTLSASFNIGMNRSRIDKLDGVNSKPITSGWASTDLREVDDFVLQVGQPVGLIYGYVADGMYKIDDFNYDPVKKTYTLKPGIPDDRNIISAVNFGPGSLKLKKLSPDTSVVISPDKDRKVIGNTNPLSSGGFNITSTYKGFDLTLFFNWVYGDKVYNANKIDFTSYWNRQYTNYLSTVDYAHRYKYIDGSGNIVTDPVALADLNKNATMWSPLMGRPVVTSLAVEDGSFLRLNNVTLGYSLPKKLISKVHMTQFRLYCTIYNAWLLTNYTGYDPEVNTIRTTSLTPNVDYNAYPKARSYTVGVNVTF